ncbi:hypothetical protein SEA_CARON_49 [Microbacterium phage Caron]|uniref:Uncharacterized protein n=1 Tax=Microbacterium phage Caron TaxID=3028494 RepID=A0AAE9ZLI7_9CAUD|nr:hypothetical protein SEA_CARON_49 [Microbacterium phage Caron]
MATSPARLLVTERPYFRIGLETYYLDREAYAEQAPRVGDVVILADPDGQPDADGDLEVIFGEAAYAISTSALAEVID